jgi:hypothetical protein
MIIYQGVWSDALKYLIYFVRHMLFFFLMNAFSKYFSTSSYIAVMCTISNHSAKCLEKWVIDPTKKTTLSFHLAASANV